MRRERARNLIKFRLDPREFENAEIERELKIQVWESEEAAQRKIKIGI